MYASLIFDSFAVSGFNGSLKVTRTPGRFSALFARVKGETEKSLLAISSENPGLRVFNVRPGFIDPTQGLPLREGQQPFMFRAMNFAAPAIRALAPSHVIPTGSLANVLVRCVEEKGSLDEIRSKMNGVGCIIEGDNILLENTGIRRLAGL